MVTRTQVFAAVLVSAALVAVAAIAWMDTPDKAAEPTQTHEETTSGAPVTTETREETTAITPTTTEAIDEYLLRVNGTVREGKPVNYVRSPEFSTNGSRIRIVLRLWANQKINATIEVARIIGYYVSHDRRGDVRYVEAFGGYPNKAMNRTTWDFRTEYSTTLYASLETVPAGEVAMVLAIEIFVEGPNFASNPSFLVYWEITVYDASQQHNLLRASPRVCSV